MAPWSSAIRADDILVQNAHTALTRLRIGQSLWSDTPAQNRIELPLDRVQPRHEVGRLRFLLAFEEEARNGRREHADDANSRNHQEHGNHAPFGRHRRDVAIADRRHRRNRPPERVAEPGDITSGITSAGEVRNRLVKPYSLRKARVGLIRVARAAGT